MTESWVGPGYEATHNVGCLCCAVFWLPLVNCQNSYKKHKITPDSNISVTSWTTLCLLAWCDDSNDEAGHESDIDMP